MEKKSNVSGIFAAITIPICAIVAFLVFYFVMGDKSNFINDDPAGTPKEGNFLGVIFKGGIIVPFLLTAFLAVVVFSIERFLTLNRATGKGNVASFVKKVQYHLANHDLAAANDECDKQKGSVANVIKAGLKRYHEMEDDHAMSKDQKLLAIQKDIEESTALELPMLEKNLPVIATLAPLGTLIGLLGTVVGMIKSFNAMAHAGAPDASELSKGISEALINTATGILTSALAIISYNYFTNQIDGLTYGIDEAGYSLQQTFAEKNK